MLHFWSQKIDYFERDMTCNFMLYLMKITNLGIHYHFNKIPA